MGRKRDLYLEANILLTLKKHRRMRSSTIAKKLGVNLDQLRLSLSDLSYEGMTHRSQSGVYSLDRNHRGSPRRAGRPHVRPGSDPGEQAKRATSPPW